MRLNLGSGNKGYGDYIGIDIKEPADIIHDLRNIPWPCDTESIDEIVSSHFLQELRWDDVKNVFKECYRILKPTGRLEINVPDMEMMIRSYLKGETDLFIAGQKSIPAKFMWQLQWKGSYQSFYNGPLLIEKLEEAGFKAKVIPSTNRADHSVTVEAIK